MGDGRGKGGEWVTKNGGWGVGDREWGVGDGGRKRGGGGWRMRDEDFWFMGLEEFGLALSVCSCWV